MSLRNKSKTKNSRKNIGNISDDSSLDKDIHPLSPNNPNPRKIKKKQISNENSDNDDNSTQKFDEKLAISVESAVKECALNFSSLINAIDDDETMNMIIEEPKLLQDKALKKYQGKLGDKPQHPSEVSILFAQNVLQGIKDYEKKDLNLKKFKRFIKEKNDDRQKQSAIKNYSKAPADKKATESVKKDKLKSNTRHKETKSTTEKDPPIKSKPEKTKSTKKTVKYDISSEDESKPEKSSNKQPEIEPENYGAELEDNQEDDFAGYMDYVEDTKKASPKTDAQEEKEEFTKDQLPKFQMAELDDEDEDDINPVIQKKAYENYISPEQLQKSAMNKPSNIFSNAFKKDSDEESEEESDGEDAEEWGQQSQPTNLINSNDTMPVKATHVESMFNTFQTNTNPQNVVEENPDSLTVVDFKSKLLERRKQMKNLAQAEVDIKEADREMTEEEKKAMHENNNQVFGNDEHDDLFFGDDGGFLPEGEEIEFIEDEPQNPDELNKTPQQIPEILNNQPEAQVIQSTPVTNNQQKQTLDYTQSYLHPDPFHKYRFIESSAQFKSPQSVRFEDTFRKIMKSSFSNFEQGSPSKNIYNMNLYDENVLRNSNEYFDRLRVSQSPSYIHPENYNNTPQNMHYNPTGNPAMPTSVQMQQNYINNPNQEMHYSIPLSHTPNNNQQNNMNSIQGNLQPVMAQSLPLDQNIRQSDPMMGSPNNRHPLMAQSIHLEQFRNMSPAMQQAILSKNPYMAQNQTNNLISQNISQNLPNEDIRQNIISDKVVENTEQNDVPNSQQNIQEFYVSPVEKRLEESKAAGQNEATLEEAITADEAKQRLEMIKQRFLENKRKNQQNENLENNHNQNVVNQQNSNQPPQITPTDNNPQTIENKQNIEPKSTPIQVVDLDKDLLSQFLKNNDNSEKIQKKIDDNEKIPQKDLITQTTEKKPITIEDQIKAMKNKNPKQNTIKNEDPNIVKNGNSLKNANLFLKKENILLQKKLNTQQENNSENLNKIHPNQYFFFKVYDKNISISKRYQFLIRNLLKNYFV